MDLDDLCRHFLRCEAEQIRAAAAQRLSAEPEEVAAQRGRDQRRCLDVRRDLAPLDEDLLIEREADGATGANFDGHRIDVELLDGADRGGLVRWREDQSIANL